VLDGDLPKADWFDGPMPGRLAAGDGEINTVVPGRPIGLHPEDVGALADRGIHLHFYGDFTQGQWRGWIERSRSFAPDHLHLHSAVGQERWVEEFGRYDAGWLHVFQSRNEGDIRRADWDDLNIPARMATLAAAGLPMLQRANPGHTVATQSLVNRIGTGVAFDDWDDLAARLRDGTSLEAARNQLLEVRDVFTFDAHVDRLVAFLRSTIDRSAAPRRTATMDGSSSAPPVTLRRDCRVARRG